MEKLHFLAFDRIHLGVKVATYFCIFSILIELLVCEGWNNYCAHSGETVIPALWYCVDTYTVYTIKYKNMKNIKISKCRNMEIGKYGKREI